MACQIGNSCPEYSRSDMPFYQQSWNGRTFKSIMSAVTSESGSIVLLSSHYGATPLFVSTHPLLVPSLDEMICYGSARK